MHFLTVQPIDVSLIPTIPKSPSAEGECRLFVVLNLCLGFRVPALMCWRGGSEGTRKRRGKGAAKQICSKEKKITKKKTEEAADNPFQLPPTSSEHHHHPTALVITSPAQLCRICRTIFTSAELISACGSRWQPEVSGTADGVGANQVGQHLLSKATTTAEASN